MLEILENLALVGLSIALLWKCSDWLVESAARVGRQLGFSELTTGLVIVAICTSAPEFAVSVMALVGCIDSFKERLKLLKCGFTELSLGE